MMSIQEVSAEQFAKLFHHYYEALAPDFNCADESQGESWPEVPSNERGRMVAAARLVLLDLRSGNNEMHEREPYFAKPGEAEWGC
jgi:hypothetical protein